MTETGPQKSDSLESLVSRHPQPRHPLHGKAPQAVALPENIFCFQRRSASELNRPNKGRALHHRHVLVFAVHGTVTISVDDREVCLSGGEGLLIFPFQFHHYIDATSEELSWLYVTFELAASDSLEPMRFRSFALAPEIRRELVQLLESYADEQQAERVPLFLAIILSRLRNMGHKRAPRKAATTAPQLVTRVNTLAQGSNEALSIQDIADSLGISTSHLRERFRASCGVSLGHHLRRLRLEKACGLLRLTSQRVSEIADQCGFTSIYSFSRAFREAYGISPRQYRNDR
jgi:AraC-like DNA-binding protein